MLITGITDEDFVNFKIPSMFISTATCSFKCDKECGKQVCQNSELAKVKPIFVADDEIIDRYVQNPITHAIVFGGLEPFDQMCSMFALITRLRERGCDDDVVIYTGYNKEEVQDKLAPFFWPNRVPHKNLIIKWGRFIPDQKPHFDEVLGVKLASDNQYAERIFS